MKLNTRKIVFIALYTALFVVLSIVGTINMQGIKITLQNLPIYVCAITMGMVPGTIVGFLGMLISQMITYGLSATTLFWVLPQTILGATCGYIFETKKIQLNNIKFYVIIIVLQLMLTVLNTIVYAIDGLIYGYYNYLVIFGPIIIKLMASVLTGLVYCIIIPIIVKMLKKIH